MTAMTIAEAVAKFTTTDPRFAVGAAKIRGVRFRVFENAPASLREMMQRAADAHGDGDFVVYQDDRLSYAGFCDRTCRLAHALTGLGVKPGDRVAIAMRNYPELLLLMMAISSIGAVVVFVNAWWTAREMEYAFADSAAKLCFADGPRMERISAFAGRLGIRLIGVRDGEDGAEASYSALMATSHDTAWPRVGIDADADFAIMYSSGSTGHPKGAVLTHRGAISAVLTWMLSGEVGQMLTHASLGVPTGEAVVEQPVVLICTPLFHVTATHPVWLLSIAIGARVVLLRKWDAEEAVRVIRREAVTRFIGVPTQSIDLMVAARRMGLDMPTLEYLGAGGAKRPPAQVAELAEAFPGRTVASGWGMTETNACGLGLAGPDYLARPGAAGRLLPPLQDMKICDDDGNEVPNGTVGEMVVKSPANMRCYLNQPDATVEVLRDGWLHTGDLAFLDDDGFYTIVDRKKNIIIRGGENIAALDVEAAIHRHPAVIEAVAFSVPDQRLGETVGAAVVLRDGENVCAGALNEFLAGTIAPFKIPERIWFMGEALPRGATDKIDRRALRDDCLARMAAASDNPARKRA